MLALSSHVRPDIPSTTARSTVDDHTRFGALLLAYRAANVVFAANALGVFQATEGGRTAAEIAHNMGSEVRATTILLEALCALEFLHKDQQRYDNTSWGRNTFLPTGTSYLGHNCMYQALTGQSWTHLPQVVQSGRAVSTYADLMHQHPEFLRAHMAAMDEIAHQPAQHLASQLDLSGVQTMLDVGAGPGTFARTFLEHAPHLRVTLLDLPTTLTQSEPFFARWPHRDQVTLQAGDYHTTPFGHELYDLVLLSHITHNEGEAENQALFANASLALRAGGQIILHDFMIEEENTPPLFAALFAVHMLVLTPRGRVYARRTYESWLLQAGFHNFRVLPLCPGALNTSVAIIATKMPIL